MLHPQRLRALHHEIMHQRAIAGSAFYRHLTTPRMSPDRAVGSTHRQSAPSWQIIGCWESLLQTQIGPHHSDVAGLGTSPRSMSLLFLPLQDQRLWPAPDCKTRQLLRPSLLLLE